MRPNVDRLVVPLEERGYGLRHRVVVEAITSQQVLVVPLPLGNFIERAVASRPLLHLLEVFFFLGSHLSRHNAALEEDTVVDIFRFAPLSYASL